jgi:N-methylhydantoinase B/oxoprolinase/acetone carboxylase alpha subunit
MSDGRETIRLQVMWRRLLAVVEGQARSLVRTAFSATVSEAGDLSAGLFDRQGRMIAQAVTGTPGHVNSMAESVAHFLAKYPLDQLEPGDHVFTNDPWLSSGHLHDITVVSPVFRRGRAIALFACTCHQVDIGGLGQGPDGRSVYEEGLYIPILKLARAGRVNEDLIEMIRANVRAPDAVEGDVRSYMICNEGAGARLNELLDETGEADIDGLAEFVIERSAAAMRAEISKLPPGRYENEMSIDGVDEPITLRAALTIETDRVRIDYAGSSPASRHGINLVMAYSRAYSAFGVRAAVAPGVPNNAGSLAPIEVVAPEGSILNVSRPRPVCARHIIGQFLPDVVLGALAQALPERIPAEGASCVWGIQLRGGPEAEAGGASNRRSAPFDVIFFNSGGSGARPTKDGLSGTAFPSGVKALPIEAVETLAPVVVWRKELLADSGGPGEFRGGLAQRLEVGTLDGAPFAVFAMYDRVRHPARGRSGGGAGGAGTVALDDGGPIAAMGKQVIGPDRRLCLDLPGGGGFGEPSRRTLAALARDVAEGYVTAEAARRDYGTIDLDDEDGV